MNVPLRRAIAATGATVLGADRLPAEVRVTLDSRSLQRGDTFLALRGERFDAHAFVAGALRSGAAAAIVDDPRSVPEGSPAFVVADTKAALLALAAEARGLLRARVVAITGSTGKTTTKEFLAQLLRAAGTCNVLATPANENNEIGVAKLFLGADQASDVIVVECGARHFGDIATLARIALPEVAVLTNVADAHLEIMGSRERLADTKWQIFSTGARAVLDELDEVSQHRRRSLDAPPWWFGASAAAYGAPVSVPCARAVTQGRAGDELVRYEPGRVERAPMVFRLPGAHNRRNLAAACAAAFALGLETGAVAAAISSLELPSGRYERMRIGGFDVIFDAYNASMSGTLAALDAFASERAPRRIAVIAGMKELGDDSAAMHERVGAAAAEAGLDALLVGGEHAADLARGARAAGLAAERLVRFAGNDDVVRWLRDNAGAGDLVLLKGSRVYRLEEVVEGLRGAR